MTRNQIVATIEKEIENGYAETRVGFHTKYQTWGGEWRRGAYAQIAAPYGGTRRIYAPSYAALLATVREAQS
jgi:hypothetical protein